MKASTQVQMIINKVLYKSLLIKQQTWNFFLLTSYSPLFFRMVSVISITKLDLRVIILNNTASEYCHLQITFPHYVTVMFFFLIIIVIQICISWGLFAVNFATLA